MKAGSVNHFAGWNFFVGLKSLLKCGRTIKAAAEQSSGWPKTTKMDVIYGLSATF